MWTFVLECRPNVDLFEQKGPHVDLWRKMWTYLATLQFYCNKELAKGPKGL